MIALTETLFQHACPIIVAIFGEKHSFVWQITVHPSAWSSKYMSVYSQDTAQTLCLSMHWLKSQSLSHSNMAGISKAATHAVSQLKWTPHRGKPADVMTRLLCCSGTTQDSQIFVLFSLLDSDVLSKPSSGAPPCRPPA